MCDENSKNVNNWNTVQCFAFWQSSYNNIGCHKLSCLSKNLWLFATSLKLEILAIQSKDYSLHVTKILILFETPLLEMKFHPVTKKVCNLSIFGRKLCKKIVTPRKCGILTPCESLCWLKYFLKWPITFGGKLQKKNMLKMVPVLPTLVILVVN